MQRGIESALVAEDVGGNAIRGRNDPDLGSRVARNLAVLAAARGAAAALQFAAFAIVASHLGPELLGVYTFAIAMVALFRLIPTFGFEQIVPRDIAQRPELEASLVPNVLYVRVLLALLAYGALGVSLVAIGYEPRARDAALLAGFALVLVAGETLRASLAVRLRLGWSAAADLAEAAVVLIGAVLLVSAGSGISSFIVLYVAAKAVNVALVMIGGAWVTSYRWRPRPSTWWPAVRHAAPLAAAALVIALYYRLDMVVLARLAPADEVGQYGLALKFLDAAVLLTAVLMSVLQPLLARAVVDGRAVLQQRYSTSVHLTAVLATLVAVAGAMTAWRLLPELPGLGAYEGAGVALSLLAPAAGIILVATVVQGTLLAGRLERSVLWISLAGLAVNVALIAVLIPTYSYVGAAIATSLTELALIVLSLRATRALGIRWPLGKLGRLTLAAVVLVAVLTLGYLVHPFLQLALGVAAFGAAVLAFRVVDRRELVVAFRRPT